MIRKRFLLAALVSLISLENITAQVSKSWVADLGNGKYKNPILHADYSDPDVVRVGDDYYMTASSFDAVPGLPILHSKDLVNWTIIGHALKRQIPYEHFSKTQHGNGVWAPSIRYHNGLFYIYYPDPDFGIYVITAKDPAGEWSEPILVEGGKGLIDPCPLWDDDGKVYLTHAYAGSRAGIKSVLVVKEMNREGTKTINEGVLVYDGHELDPTVEGPKFYKRNGYYYLFAPAGGVSTGWQIVLRAKNPYGPYERKMVMEQGNTPINGPHQGAWVDTRTGEDWFLHFQEKDPYGRLVHLQPMKWVNDWPVIGEDKDGDGIGWPVLTYKKPNVGKTYPITTPAESDEFNSAFLGLQWQWQANPRATWSFMNTQNGSLRLFAQPYPEEAKSYWDVPNLLLQKFPAETFTATTKLKFQPLWEGDKVGFVVMGLDYAYIGLEKTRDDVQLVYAVCEKADKEKTEVKQVITSNIKGDVYFQIKVSKEGKTSFAYSLDGKNFQTVSVSFTAKQGKWIGAKLGYFITSTQKKNDAGYVDVDWFRID